VEWRLVVALVLGLKAQVHNILLVIYIDMAR